MDLKNINKNESSDNQKQSDGLSDADFKPNTNEKQKAFGLYRYENPRIFCLLLFITKRWK